MKQLTAVLVILFIFSPFYSLNAGDLKKMTLEMLITGKGEKLSNSLPYVPGWMDDNYYFHFKQGKLFKVNAKTGKSDLVLKGSKDSKVKVDSLLSFYSPAEHTEDYKKFLILKKGTISLFSIDENTLIPLLESNAEKRDKGAKNPKFSPDGSKFAYTQDGDLYVYDIAARKNKRLTTDGTDDILNGYASWVYYEEILGRRSRYRAFWWSPDSKRIVFMRFDQSQVPAFHLYRAKGDYGYLESLRYPKAGYPNPTVKIAVADVNSGNIDWLPFEDKNEHYLAFPEWNHRGNKVYFQWMNRGQDHIKILAYHLDTKKIHPVYEEKQKTWVNFFSGNDFTLLKNDDIIMSTSKDGWFHIYYISNTGKERQLTSGEWSVSNIDAINPKKKRIYFSADKEESTQSHFYSIDFSGKKMKKLTVAKGQHRVTVSPTGRYFVDRFSGLTTPAKMELRDYRGKLIRKIGDSYNENFEKYEISKVKAELFRIKTDDGFELPAAWYLPPNFDKTKKYPVVITIYGGPGSAIVGDSYGTGYRRGWRKFFLAQEGIINLFVDNRGSFHFGKKGMDLMHRKLGKWELYDYIQTVKYLRTQPFVDAEKIGITGHSYGGYMTAYALTKGGEYFKYGISGSLVSDWKLYDSVYTERFMDTPQENPEGYKEGNCINFVDGYNGVMRLTHGTMDDNVHPQNAIQLVEAILNAGKTLEFMLYPGDRHGIRGPRRFEYIKSDINFWFKHFFGKTL